MGIKFKDKVSAGIPAGGDIEEREIHLDLKNSDIYTSSDGSNVIKIGGDKNVINDTLLSTVTIESLSANQGKVLNDKVLVNIAKLNTINSGAQVNVQADWDATTSQAGEILNKPAVIVEAQRNVPGGFVGIDSVTHKLDMSVLPALPTGDVHAAVDEAGQLALTGIVSGDIIIRDDGKIFFANPSIATSSPSVITDYTEIVIQGAVDQVNGKTGVVSLSGGDILLDGYIKPANTSAIVAADTLNEALGKLERRVAAQPAGVMFDFGGATAPAGALVCNGQLVDQAQYSDLYVAIGDVWANTGGAANPSASEFRLPPSSMGGMGLFTRGVGAVGVGSYEGDITKSHSHTANHNHSAHSNTKGNHSHNRNIAQSTNTITNGSDWTVGGGPNVKAEASTTAGNHNHTITVDIENLVTDISGGGETRPRTITVLKCIWTGK